GCRAPHRRRRPVRRPDPHRPLGPAGRRRAPGDGPARSGSRLDHRCRDVRRRRIHRALNRGEAMTAINELALADVVLRSSSTAPTTPDEAATPLLLLHPWFGCREFWDPVAARFGAVALAPDWYSLGSTGDWSRWATPAGLADAALALMDHV